MTLKGTLGSYKVFQTVITVNSAGGSNFLQVKLGNTAQLASAKLDPVSWPTCTNTDLLTC